MRITSKGQVTIPQAIRDELGLHPHTDVEFVVERGRAVLRPARGAARNRARLLVDRLKQGPRMTMTSKQLLALLRDPPNEIDSD
ncbi:MAG: AbrB/MazE/SpoVT family DNA-binding domain-containing protein [Cyanobacteria bacterium]|nr:AbrB/MazE/SpoVT family DNA-binding domain-containing protein [Cyanobacteriota bacterium]